ncbi:MAG: division/cell wall cluster transcriptional repressor MraZ [Clostridiales bacterium]|nr:division/cell wall cluster transcriptional repressor MraZ [Clostridiales bacterium]
MTCEYQHSIDAKGRLFIPAKLREELGDVCYVTISMDRCLFVYSESSWKAFCDKFDALPMSQSRKMRVMFANTSKCELDAQGRVLIPQKLREYAVLKKNVTIIGFSNHAEIWDSGEYAKLEAEELTPENIAAAMKELGL